MKSRRRRIRPYRPMTPEALARLKEARTRKQEEIKNGISKLKPCLSPERLRLKELQDEIDALGPLD
jgi:hypothetical protein